MKITIRNIKKLLLAAALICCTLLFASCGAKVDTEFTADSNFAGTRIITLTLSNSDLSEYVPGGKDSIEATIKKYMPDCLTYSLTEGEGSLVCKFTLAFTGIDDYKSKAAKVLAAEIDDPVTAEIEYENVGSPFKSSLRFKENFSSMDLIGWFRYGLQKDEVVKRDTTSDWFEIGSTTVSIGGTEYSSYSSISVDDSVYNTPDSIIVKTYFLTSGNYDRTIEFRFSNDTLTKLSEQSVNVEEYFNGVVSSSKVEKIAEEYETIYSLKMTGLTAEQIAAETAKILQSENVVFETTIGPDVNVSRRMLINVNEKLEGLYYLRNERNLSSVYFLYNGAELSDSSEVSFSYHYDNDLQGFSYIPSYIDAESAHSSFIWDVDFESAGASLDFSGKKVNLDIMMYASSDMLAEAKQILNDSITNAVPDGAKLKTSEEEGNTVYTIDFGTKAPEDEAAIYREFVYNYTGEKAECEFALEKGVSKSPFKTITSYSVVVDMSDLSDDEIDFTFKKSGSLFVLDNSQVTTYAELANKIAETDYGIEGMSEEEAAEAAEVKAKSESADYTGVFRGTLRFYAIEENVNIFAVIILTTLIFCAVALIVVIAFSLKTWLAAIKSTPKPALQATVPTASIPQNIVTAETDENNTNPETNEDEEEYV